MKGSTEELLALVQELERQLIEVRRKLEPDRESVPSHDVDILEVRVADGTYGVAIESIETVLPMVWPQPLPEAPDWVLGTFQYGRQVVPLIDLHARLADARPDLDVSWKIIVVRHGTLVGLVVSDIGDITRAESASLVPPSAEIPQAPFLVASLPRPEGGTVHLLSTERLSRDLLLDE